MKHCDYCDVVAAAGDKFCRNCGTELLPYGGSPVVQLRWTSSVWVDWNLPVWIISEQFSSELAEPDGSELYREDDGC